MELEWKDIEGFDGRYQISNTGIVRSYYRGKWTVKTLCLCGPPTKKYLFVKLSKNNIESYPKIHKLVFSHFIGAIPEGLDIDHIDRNKLNNLVSNLRALSRSDNILNSAKSSTRRNTSKYKGVYWNSQRNKWQAQYTVNYDVIYIGRFDSEVEAAKAYNEAISKVSSYAFLNEIPEEIKH